MADLRGYLASGSRSSGELSSAAGISRATLMRAVRDLGDEVLVLGRARATRYALKQRFPGLAASEFPAFRVDEAGAISEAGTLITLAATQSVWLPDETVLDGLPAEIHDMAPRGFLGGSFATRHADLALPRDVTSWSDHHVLKAVALRGEDLPGNLIVGKESFARWQELSYEDTDVAQFPALAESALAGEHTGSSAGGERPKFTCLHNGEHCIVKFANAKTDNGRRWQDLLLLEHLALETLRDHGVAAARSEIVDEAGWRFLVVYRFDRVATQGRVRAMSLAAASQTEGGTWVETASALQREGLMSAEDVRTLTVLEAFGAQIANTDRHLHNVSVFPRDSRFELAPAFDQLPMAYAPQASGNMRDEPVPVARPTADTLGVWEEAGAIALAYWAHAVGLDLTGSMQAIVAEHARR